jgi:hypothetical protein
MLPEVRPASASSESSEDAQSAKSAQSADPLPLSSVSPSPEIPLAPDASPPLASVAMASEVESSPPETIAQQKPAAKPRASGRRRTAAKNASSDSPSPSAAPAAQAAAEPACAVERRRCRNGRGHSQQRLGRACAGQEAGAASTSAAQAQSCARNSVTGKQQTGQAVPARMM